MLDLPKNPESVSLTLTQTSKGFFYIDKLNATGSTPKEMLANLDYLLTETNKRLIELNKEKKE